MALEAQKAEREGQHGQKQFSSIDYNKKVTSPENGPPSNKYEAKKQNFINEYSDDQKIRNSSKFS